jgi:hypothetical protein
MIFSPTPAVRAPSNLTVQTARCPNLTILGKENFTKNLNGKITMNVKQYQLLAEMP